MDSLPNAGDKGRAIKRPLPLSLIVVAVLFVVMPFLFWRQTWFGRQLSDEEVRNYLADQERPRRIQHALAQISERIQRGDESIKREYSQVVALARHPASAIRATAAWLMGQDNGSRQFHEALLRLLEDPDLMVRRNAALALVRFGDSRGRAELTGMLRPYLVRASTAGRLSMQLKPGQRIGSSALVARITRYDGQTVEIRSPLSAEVDAVMAEDGALLAEGDVLVSLKPEAEQVWEALRGLYLIGQAEDLPAIEECCGRDSGMPARIEQQAALTAQAIRRRSEPSATR
jgi:hypothetical protein